MIRLFSWQGLPRHLTTELAAARSLYAQGLLQQTAFHLSHFWRALISLRGQDSGQASAAELETEALPVPNGRPGVDPSRWEESLAEVNRLAAMEARGELEPPGALDQAKTRRLKGLLDLQLQQAGRACRAARRDGLPSGAGGLSKIFAGRRRVMAGLCVLGLAALASLTLALTGGSPDGSGPVGLKPVPTGKEPRLKTVTQARVGKRQRAGDFWNAPGSVVFTHSLRVALPSVTRARSLEVSVDHNDVYIVIFLRDAVEMGRVRITPNLSREGLRIVTLQAPAHAVTEGYNAVKLTAVEGDGAYSLGHLMLGE